MKIMLRSVFILLIISSYSTSQQKQDLWTTFTASDGLASNFVITILESSDGALWFGTDAGVSRFEGDWITFTTSDGLAGDRVKAIFESSDGALWFGTWGSGMSRYQDKIWTAFTTTDGLTSDSVNAIVESSDGALWFGTEGGVSRYYLGSWTTFTADSGLADNCVNAIIESSEGELWFGTSNGVSRYLDGKWTTFSSYYDDWLVDNYVQVIIKSSDGALWFGTNDGVSRYQDGEWTIFNTDSGLANNNVTTILESSDGAMWFGTLAFALGENYSAVSRYQDGKWTIFTRDSGLVNTDIVSIIESSDGALWFGTFGGGVSRFQQGIWTTFSYTYAGVLVRAIFESSDGALWFGNLWGVNRYQEGTWTAFTSDSGLVGDDVRSIIESSDGALWFGTDGGASRYQDGIWTTFNAFTTDSGLVSDHITAIIESSDGALWFGTSWDGVSRYQNGTWTTFTTDSGLVGDDIRAIIESSDGALWFGTEWDGVSRYQDGTWTTLTTTDGLVSDSVRTIFESSDGALWFGTSMGVSRYHQEKWTTFTSANGLADNDVYEIMESSNGALWFGTCGWWGFGGGVSRFQDGTWTTFTTADGLADNNVMAILESSDGALWFGTYSKGVSRLKPDKIPPFTIIDRGPKNGEVLGISTPMFVFHGYDYRTKPEQLSYAYAVINENGFIVDGDSSIFFKDTAVQLNLPIDGKYTSYIRARDSWKNIDPTPATRTFIVDITQPTTTIEYPAINDTISGIVIIKGSIYDDSPLKDFEYYGIRYGKGTDKKAVAKWDTLVYPNSERDGIRNDSLGTWDTCGLRGIYQLSLFAKDALDHESEDIIPVHIVDAIGEIKTRQGGYVSNAANNIKIYFPTNSFPDNTEIKISLVSDLNQDDLNDEFRRFVGLAYDIMPKTIVPQKSGTLNIFYNDSNLVNVAEEKKLSIFRYDENENNWTLVGGTVYVKNKKVSTAISQLGRYGLFENLKEGTVSSLSHINSQPRIFSPRGGGHDTQTAISFELGKEADVTIKIYNAAGRLVRVLKENENMPYGNNVVYWDGKDDWGNFCVSDLYIVTIQAGDKLATKTVVVLNK